MSHWQGGGKWALITGASAGIGTALARELAAGGTNLVLTARRRDRLAGPSRNSARSTTSARSCVSRTWPDRSGPQEIFSFTESKNIAMDLLVNNAGFGAYGEFHKTRLDRLIEMMQVNVTAVVHMTHLYLPGMIARGGGDILIVASTASVSAGALHLDLCRDESLRLAICRGTCRRGPPVRGPRLRAVSWIHGHGVFSSGRAAQPHAPLARNSREGRSRGAYGLGGGKEFRDFRLHELDRRGNRALGAAQDGRAHHRRNLPTRENG